ncbi:MAG: ABC transporter ATP-binding protein [Treponematales bacterium]
MKVLELSGIRREYRLGEGRGKREAAVVVRALRGVDFCAEKGEFISIMGPSGSGKSTLMNILGCLDKPDAGSYLLDGIETSGSDSDAFAMIRNRKIGFVFQSFNLLARTTALENVELPLFYGPRKKRKTIRDRAGEMLREVGLGERMNHLPSQLSGGQQQRVAIARAMVNDPAFILADEPTGNLDSEMTVEIMGLFQKLNDEGKTIIMVTHEPEVAAYTKRIVTLRDGAIVSDNSVKNRRSAAGVLRAKRVNEAGGAA